MTTNTSSMPVLVAGAAGLAGAALVAAGAILLPPQPAQAFPAYAQKTGFVCGICHVNPKGGGKLSEFGIKWVSGGMKPPKIIKK